MLAEGAEIKSRLAGEEFCVTRKIDGHWQCLCYQDGQAFMFDAHGKQNTQSLRCLDLLASYIGKAGVKSAVLAAELYLPRPNGCPRSGDVPGALADPEQKDQLALAIFDIIELDGEYYQSMPYKQVHDKLTELLRVKSVSEHKGRKLTIYKSHSACKPVEMKLAKSVDEVIAIYHYWIEKQGAEGLVVHSDNGLITIIQPLYPIEVVEEIFECRSSLLDWPVKNGAAIIPEDTSEIQ